MFVCKQTGSQLFHHHLSLQLHIYTIWLQTGQAKTRLSQWFCAFGWPLQCSCASFARWHSVTLCRGQRTVDWVKSIIFRWTKKIWIQVSMLLPMLQCFQQWDARDNALHLHLLRSNQCFASIFQLWNELWRINSLVLWNPGFFFGILSGIPRKARSAWPAVLMSSNCSSLVECADFGQAWSKAAWVHNAGNSWICLPFDYLNEPDYLIRTTSDLSMCAATSLLPAIDFLECVDTSLTRL